MQARRLQVACSRSTLRSSKPRDNQILSSRSTYREQATHRHYWSTWPRLNRSHGWARLCRDEQRRAIDERWPRPALSPALPPDGRHVGGLPGSRQWPGDRDRGHPWRRHRSGPAAFRAGSVSSDREATACGGFWDHPDRPCARASRPKETASARSSASRSRHRMATCWACSGPSTRRRCRSMCGARRPRHAGRAHRLEGMGRRQLARAEARALEARHGPGIAPPGRLGFGRRSTPAASLLGDRRQRPVCRAESWDRAACSAI
jgi:hypothetical protein